MKCKMFIIKVVEAVELFNKWAKGKALTKDVIIHTVAFPSHSTSAADYLIIMVYYPEGSQFDTEE